MARTSSVLVSFNAGVFSPRMDGRVDLQKAPNAARVLRNMLVESYGRAVRRAGLRFIAPAKTAT